MESKFTEKEIEKLNTEELHGHTIIELKNVKTGKRERIEHDNTFTDGISNYLLSSGVFNNSPFATSTWREVNRYRSLTGGIFLFDKTINSVNGVYPTIMPAGTKMTANGSYGVSNSSSVTEMGSYNDSESSFNSSSLSFVYDWSTSQGNGTINSICLTSDTGGYIGYGNSSSNIASTTKKDLFENQTSNSPTVSGDRVVSTIKGNNRYYVTNSMSISETLTYTKKSENISQVSLFDLSETKTTTIPSSVTGTRCKEGASGTFCVYPSSLSLNRENTIGIFDCETETWSTEIIPQLGYSVLFTPYFFDGGVYFYNSATKVLYFYGENSGHSADLGSRIIPISDSLILGTNGYIYDAENETLYPCNMNEISITNADGFSSFPNNRIFSTRYASSNLSNYIAMYRNPLYLATVNNLESEITKTSSNTMKVTYTITKE